MNNSNMLRTLNNKKINRKGLVNMNELLFTFKNKKTYNF